MAARARAGWKPFVRCKSGCHPLVPWLLSVSRAKPLQSPMPVAPLDPAQVWALAFNSDGTRLASGGDDKLLTIYSIA
jgi:WD40 repeat protein